MGYHITVNVNNHTKYQLNLSDQNDGKGYKVDKGSMEHLQKTLAANTSTAAFTGYHSGSGDIKGWVSYGLPDSDFVMNINYGSSKSGENKSGGVFVEIYDPSDSSNYYSAAGQGYVVLVDCAYFAPDAPSPCQAYTNPEQGDEFDCTTVHLYDWDDPNLPATITNGASKYRPLSQVFVTNNTGAWIQLQGQTSDGDTYTFPGTIVNGTTSVPPNEKNMVIDFQDTGSSSGKTKRIQLTYSIDSDNAVVIEQDESNHEANAPNVTFIGNHHYAADLDPTGNGYTHYTITLTHNTESVRKQATERSTD